MKSQVKFMFLRNSKNQPVGCIAFASENNTTIYGLSILHPSDRFNRKLAREISEGRLLTAPCTLPKSNEKQNLTMVYISQKPSSRVAKLAKAWLSAKPNGLEDI